mmetsp:Transcript_43196/g.75790  ORF Transcript_43196/g.75790 Transcript_43196/m.75790 type:complete len:573 (-) Transcript_43196:20-1738(-)
MRWLKMILFSALPWHPAAVTVPSSQVSAYYVSQSRRVCGARSALINHREKAQLDQFRLREPRRAIAPLAASGQSESDGTTLTTTKSIIRRKSWEESYALLCSYRDIHGHCNVPQSEKPLGPWVNRQRIDHARYSLYKKTLKNGGENNKDESGKLPSTSMTAQRKKFLDDIDFVWDAMGHTWSTRYDELCEFRKNNGHCVVPRCNGRLGTWVEKQRIEYKKYRAMQKDIWKDDEILKTILTQDRVKQMDDIGFVWDVREKQFEQKLGQLRIFKEMNGHIDPRFMNGQLALWERKWEQQYRKYLDADATAIDVETLSGILPENRRIALENVGFSRRMFDEPKTRWVKNRRATWEERYEELKEYEEEHGHCVVPKNYGPLGSWVRAQRHLMKEKGTMGSSFLESGGLLSDERVDRLDRLGFVWDVHQWQWDQSYYELLQYKKDHNDTNVPMNYGPLGSWVFNQRAHYNNSYQKGKKSHMTPTRLELLRNIGFEFELGKKIRSAADERWQTRLDELKEYEEKWGTFSVKQNHNPTLYNWCQHQRRCYRARLQGKKSPLNKEREDALQSVGFLNGIT